MSLGHTDNRRIAFVRVRPGNVHDRPRHVHTPYVVMTLILGGPRQICMKCDRILAELRVRSHSHVYEREARRELYERLVYTMAVGDRCDHPAPLRAARAAAVQGRLLVAPARPNRRYLGRRPGPDLPRVAENTRDRDHGLAPGVQAGR